MIITSLQNSLVKHFVKLRTSKKYRIEKQKVLIEGKKCVEELKQPIHTLIIEEGQSTSLTASQTITVSSPVFRKISGMESPEGIAAEIDLPPYEDLSKKEAILVFDHLTDPGNLGTLIRTAVSFGYEGIYLTHECVDPFNEKAVRAAKGATFKIPFQVGTIDELPPHFHYYLADLEGKGIEEVEIKKPYALVLGSEAKGLSKEMRKMGVLITIPLTDQMDSLNVAIAGGILMHAMRKKNG